MKNRYAMLAFCVLLFAGNACAQTQQTAEGAQQFLSTLANEGKVQAEFRAIVLIMDLLPPTEESMAFEGVKLGYPSIASDACTTTINLSGSEPKRALTMSKAKPESSVMTQLISLPWGNSEISRGDRGVSASVIHPRFKRTFLTFVTSDTETQDRIEYAMKFLKMSCDSTAITGF